MAYLTTVHALSLHAQYQGSHILDTYLEDAASGLNFYVLSLDGVVSIHLGVHNGEPWYRWVWMWESTQEADLALNKLPPGFDEALEAVISSIQNFLLDNQATDNQDTRLCSLDLTPYIVGLGLEMAALDMSKEQAVRELAQYRRLAASSGKTP